MSAAWTNTLKNRRNALPAANAHRHQRIAALDALQFMQGFDSPLSCCEDQTVQVKGVWRPTTRAILALMRLNFLFV